MSAHHRPRLIGGLVGDIQRTPSAQVKYGLLFEAIARRFELIEVYDASLHGTARILNALRMFHPNQQRWRQRFYKNLPAFRTRSQLAASHFANKQADVILQVGVLFDAQWGAPQIPSVIYTDYTAVMAAKRPESGRVPFTEAENEAWIQLECEAFLRASAICTRSEVTRQSIIQDYGIEPEKVTSIGGGINFEELPPAIDRSQNEQPTALFIGKDFYRKGGDILVKAFAIARQQIPNARLLLVTGETMPPDLPLDGVEVIPSTWDRSVIARLYARSDVFVLPSRLETWGDVLLEAMAFGLPCIGVAGEAMEEIIVSEQHGLVVPPKDVEALAAALICLLGNRALRLDWGEAARQRVASHFTWDAVIDRLFPIVEEVIAR